MHLPHSAGRPRPEAERRGETSEQRRRVGCAGAGTRAAVVNELDHMLEAAADTDQPRPRRFRGIAKRRANASTGSRGRDGKHQRNRYRSDAGALCRTAKLSETEPPIDWMFSRTTSMPTPRPETFVKGSALEKPGAKTYSNSSLSVNSRTHGLGEQPHRQGFGVDARDVEPAAVVGDVDDGLFTAS